MVFVNWLYDRCSKIKEFMVYIFGGIFFVIELYDSFRMVSVYELLSKGGMLFDNLLLNS